MIENTSPFTIILLPLGKNEGPPSIMRMSSLTRAAKFKPLMHIRIPPTKPRCHCPAYDFIDIVSVLTKDRAPYRYPLSEMRLRGTNAMLKESQSEKSRDTISNLATYLKFTMQRTANRTDS